MHTPANDPGAEPGPHDSARVTPQPPVPPEMTPTLPEIDPEKTKETEDDRTSGL
jgi:hypothetical protein